MARLLLISWFVHGWQLLDSMNGCLKLSFLLIFLQMSLPSWYFSSMSSGHQMASVLLDKKKRRGSSLSLSLSGSLLLLPFHDALVPHADKRGGRVNLKVVVGDLNVHLISGIMAITEDLWDISRFADIPLIHTPVDLGAALISHVWMLFSPRVGLMARCLGSIIIPLLDVVMGEV